MLQVEKLFTAMLLRAEKESKFTTFDRCRAQSRIGVRIGNCPVWKDYIHIAY